MKRDLTAPLLAFHMIGASATLKYRRYFYLQEIQFLFMIIIALKILLASFKLNNRSLAFLKTISSVFQILVFMVSMS